MRACRRRPSTRPALCPEAPLPALSFSSFLANHSFVILFLLSLCPCLFFTQLVAPSFSAATTPEDCLQIRRAVELPSGLVAADIVGAVEKNRRAASGDAPLSVQAEMSGEVGPPFVIGGAPPVEGHDQYCPAIAFDGINYLVVWMGYPAAHTGMGRNIYGARINTSGTVLDPNGIAIAEVPGEQNYPALAFDGTNYLVVWMDQRSGASDIYGARVSTSGIVLEPGGFPISNAPNDQYWPAIAFDGMNYLVLWADFRSGSDYDIYGARVDASGNVLDPGGLPVSTAPNDQYWPALAYDGTNYMAVWADARRGLDYDIYGTRVSPSGSVVDPAGIAISTALDDQYVPAIAFDGTQYFVVWADKRVGSWDIYGSRLTASGSVLDPSGIPISPTLNDQYWPAIVFDGSKYMVVWEDNRDGSQYWDIYAAQVFVSGTVRTPAGISIATEPGYQRYPALAAGPSYMLLVAYQGIVPCGTYGTYLIWGNIWTGTPTALAFSSGSASGKEGCVTLTWQMGIDVPASSFVIQRAESQSDEFIDLSLSIRRDSEFSFSGVDYDVLPGKTYWYKIVLLSASGEETYGPMEVHVDQVVARFRADPTYPNPCKLACTIPFEIPEACRVSLSVFDVSGTLIRTLVEGERTRGPHREVWDGRDEHGIALPSGVYFYALEIPKGKAVKKIVLLR